MKIVKIDDKVHAEAKAEAKKRGMLFYVFLSNLIKDALKKLPK